MRDERGEALGVVLAAGAGTRWGGTKALARDAAGVPWLVRAISALSDGGCDRTLVVLGAEAEAARRLLADPLAASGAPVDVIVAPDWAEGISRSLVAAIDAARGMQPVPHVLVITLVDLPEQTAGAVARVLARSAAPGALARATFSGRPGHPVVLGREHWDAVRATVSGDEGAARYLAMHEADLIECADLGGGDDLDAR